MIENFLHFIGPRLRRGFEPKTILDLGCCSGEQSVELAVAFPNADVHAFECSPDVLRLASENFTASGIGMRLQLHSVAVDCETGEREFWVADPTINCGAGSFFVSTGHERIQPLNQGAIKVTTTRLDEWAVSEGITRFDLVWADLQGAELAAFWGMGELLLTVEAAHVEVAFQELYRGQPLLDEVRSYLQTFGLRLWVVIHDASGYFGDAIFIRDV